MLSASLILFTLTPFRIIEKQCNQRVAKLGEHESGTLYPILLNQSSTQRHFSLVRVATRQSFQGGAQSETKNIVSASSEKEGKNSAFQWNWSNIDLEGLYSLVRVEP